jgi:AcrR family transcriptional regulator
MPVEPAKHACLEMKHTLEQSSPAGGPRRVEKRIVVIHSYVCLTAAVKTRQTQADTAARLLDAAERLFGELGYDGVGMRALAQEAKVNLAAATYHFGSKKALFLETFLRRLRAVNEARLKLLDQASAASANPVLAVETILDCLMRPSFEMGLAHPAFGELLARTLGSPPPFLQPELQREMEPNVRVFIAALERALPGLPEAVLRLRLMMSMGPLLMLTVQMGKARGARRQAQDAQVLREVVRFAASGMESAPAGADARHLMRLLRAGQPR